MGLLYIAFSTFSFRERRM